MSELPYNPYTGDEHRTFTLAGSGTAVLLVHGFPGTADEMRPLAEVFNGFGWTAQSLLLPGFGPELETVAQRNWREWVSAVRVALTELRRNHETVLLVGHSMGGALSLHVAASEGPDKLLLLAPFWKMENVLWELLPVLKHVIKEFKPFRLTKVDFNDPETRKGIQTFMPGVDVDDPRVRQGVLDFTVPTNLVAQIRSVGEAAYASAPQLNVPTIVIQGKNDDTARPAVTRQLVQRMPASTQYHEVNAEHNLPFNTQPSWEATRELLVAFAQS